MIGNNLLVKYWDGDVQFNNSLTNNITIPTVDINKSAVLIWAVSDNSSTNNQSYVPVRAEFINSTTVQVTREEGVDPSKISRFSIIVIEAVNIVSHQFFDAVVVNGVATVNQAISSVDDVTNQVVLVPTTSSTSTAGNNKTQCTAELTNSTTVKLDRSTATGRSLCSFWVLEMPREV